MKAKLAMLKRKLAYNVLRDQIATLESDDNTHRAYALESANDDFSVFTFRRYDDDDHEHETLTLEFHF